MHKDLEYLNGLDSSQLHAEGRNRSQRLAGTTWEMAVCLLAIDQRKTYWERKYTSTVQYAVMEFGMDAHRAGELLRAAHQLQKRPLLRRAFRDGVVGWSKLREITRVVTDETEAWWLEFAKAHTAEQVARSVVLRPRQLKAQQAAAQAEAAPQQLHLQPSEPAPSADPIAPLTPTTTAPTPTATVSTPTSTSATPPPVPNKRIRVTLDLTADQYAIVEQARNEQHRRQGGRRPSVEQAFTQICRDYLANGSPTARLKSQHIVHTNEERSQHWYETDRGLLPATTCPSARTNAMKPAQNFQVEHTAPPPPSRRRRPAVPREVVRAVRARSNGRCEMPGCGRGGRLHLHHTTPISDGGQHTVDTLRLLCAACHALHHETDFNHRPAWRQARNRAIGERLPNARGPSG